LVLGFVFVTRTAEAIEPIPSVTDNLFTLGPSLAYAPGEGQRSGFLAGTDATITAGFGWGSLGARVRPGESWNVYPYVEAGVWFVVNFGVGYSLGLGPKTAPQNWNWFVGLPIPLGAIGEDEPLFFLEPYYRPTMSIDASFPTLHELGLLAKWAWPVGSKE
jgi:hypothetical protein